MLTLSQLRSTRIAKGISRPQLSTLTGMSETRLKELELRTHEPWFDEACLLSRALCVDGLAPLITSGSLTDCDFGLPLENDAALWRAGARSPLSLACRVAKSFGLSDPAALSVGSLARQIWDIVGSNDRHPEHAGVCPWCAADIALGHAHLPTCLPNNLWSVEALPGDAAEAAAALRPETKATRSKGIPAKNLKAHREAAHKIQKEIADVLGVHVNYYARIERADVPLTIEHADKLAEYYRVDRATLYVATQDWAVLT